MKMSDKNKEQKTNKKSFYIVMIKEGQLVIDRAIIHRENKRFYHFESYKVYCSIDCILKNQLDEEMVHQKHWDFYIFTEDISNPEKLFEMLRDEEIQEYESRIDDKKMSIRYAQDDIKKSTGIIESLKQMTYYKIKAQNE